MSNITQDLQHSILQALIEVGVPDVAEEKIHLEHPTNVEFGDYSTNVAMVYFASADKNLYKSPRHFAEAIVEKLHKKTASSEEDDQKQTSISVAGPGFINFTFSSAFLIKNMVESGQNAVSKRSVSDQKLKKTIVEYMQPNTNKPLHVGHLRNAILGSSIIRVLSEGGVNVIPATINNDRGLHIIKSMWGYLFFGGTGQNLEEVDPTLVTQNSWNEILQNWMENSQDWKVPADMEELRLQKADHFVGYWYVVGDKFAED
jgi:arginyl-tRNA synthetase